MVCERARFCNRIPAARAASQAYSAISIRFAVVRLAMPNLDGLSEEEKRRIQAASDKTKDAFARAQSGQAPRTPGATAAEQSRATSTLNVAPTPFGQTHIQKTPQGQQREDDARAVAERLNARAMARAGKQQKRANLRKEFSMAHNHELGNDGLEL